MKTKLKIKRAVFKVIKFIAPYIFFCALFCLWNVVSLHIPPFCSIIILALIVLGSVSILVLDCYQLFRNHWIKFLFFLACACWGIWIYNHVDSLPSGKFNVWLRTLNAINNALSSFFVSRGDYQVHLMPDDLTTHGYILFHFAMYVFVAAFTLSLFGRKLINSVNGFISFLMPTYAFWTKKRSEKAEALCRSIIENTVYEQMILVSDVQDANARNTLYDSYLSRDTVLAFIDDGEIPLFVRRAKRHFFLDSEAHWNLAMANLLLAKLPENPRNKPTIVLRISDDQEDLFQHWAEQARNKADVTLFSEEQMLAQNYIMRYPMLKTPGIDIDSKTGRVSGTFRVLLIGFNNQARELLKAIVCDSQFVGSHFQADIIAGKAQEYEWYCHLQPDCLREYSLNFITADVNSQSFWQIVEGKIGEKNGYNRIIICQDDDYANTTLAFRYLKLAKSHGIDLAKVLYVQIKEELLYPCLKEPRPFTIFGQRKTCYSYQNFFQDRINMIAKRMNYLFYGNMGYLKDVPDANILVLNEAKVDEAWNSLKLISQNAARAAVRGQINLIRILLGGKDCSVEFLNCQWLKDNGFAEKLTDAILEVLAEDDHLCWNAFYYMNGIRRINMNNTAFPIRPGKANYISEYNAHVRLCPYCELPAVDVFLAKEGGRMACEAFSIPDDTQKFIRHVIRKIPELWNEDVICK